VKKGSGPFFASKKGPDPFFPPVAGLLLLAIVIATTAACGDVDVYVNTAPTTTTLPRDAGPPPDVG
jgi:hypothetical protein